VLPRKKNKMEKILSEKIRVLKSKYKFEIREKKHLTEKDFDRILQSCYINDTHIIYSKTNASNNDTLYTISKYNLKKKESTSIYSDINWSERNGCIVSPFFAYSNTSNVVFFPEFNDNGSIIIKKVDIQNNMNTIWINNQKFQSICNIKIIDEEVYIFDCLSHCIYISDMEGQIVNKIFTSFDFPFDLVKISETKFLCYFFKGNQLTKTFARKEGNTHRTGIYDILTDKWEEKNVIDFKNFGWFVWLNRYKDSVFISYGKVIEKYDLNLRQTFKINLEDYFKEELFGNVVVSITNNILTINMNEAKMIVLYNI